MSVVVGEGGNAIIGLALNKTCQNCVFLMRLKVIFYMLKQKLHPNKPLQSNMASMGNR